MGLKNLVTTLLGRNDREGLHEESSEELHLLYATAKGHSKKAAENRLEGMLPYGLSSDNYASQPVLDFKLIGNKWHVTAAYALNPSDPIEAPEVVGKPIKEVVGEYQQPDVDESLEGMATDLREVHPTATGATYASIESGNPQPHISRSEQRRRNKDVADEQRRQKTEQRMYSQAQSRAASAIPGRGGGWSPSPLDEIAGKAYARMQSLYSP